MGRKVFRNKKILNHPSVEISSDKKNMEKYAFNDITKQ